MTIANDPRNRVKRGQKRDKLQVALEQIKDKPTRAVLEVIVEHLVEQQKVGIASDGPAFVRSISTSLGGAFKVELFEGTVRSRDNTNLTDITDLKVPGVVFGCFGWCQYNGTGVWEPLTIGTPSSNSNRVYIYSNHSDRMVRLRNNDTTHANRYRIVVFYKDDAL